MTDYLKYSRRTSLVAGIASSVLAYVAVKRSIWHATADVAQQLPLVDVEPVGIEEPVSWWGPATRGQIAHSWNEGVDAVFKPIVTRLAQRQL
ncbi:hypothetical protein ACKKBG_A36940 [Auxenochlorella protothecoides x Auxenochlorella symbiontica]